MYSIATVLCLLNGFPYFIWVSHIDPWEWNVFSLIDLVRSASLDNFGYLLKVTGVAAFVCGFLPLITGLLGTIRPRLKALFISSIITSAIVVLSAMVIYIGMSALYGQKSNSMIKLGMGTYILGLIIAIEIVAGFISRRKVAVTTSS